MCVYRTEDGKCRKYSENGIVSFCVDGPCPDDTPTNGDRIRSMMDKELADQLVIKIDGLEECSLYLSAPTGKMFVSRSEAVRVTMEWLEQEEED